MLTRVVEDDPPPVLHDRLVGRVLDVPEPLVALAVEMEAVRIGDVVELAGVALQRRGPVPDDEQAAAVSDVLVDRCLFGLAVGRLRNGNNDYVVVR